MFNVEVCVCMGARQNVYAPHRELELDHALALADERARSGKYAAGEIMVVGTATGEVVARNSIPEHRQAGRLGWGDGRAMYLTR